METLTMQKNDGEERQYTAMWGVLAVVIINDSISCDTLDCKQPLILDQQHER